MPICVGGGIRKLKDIENLLKAGADKVSINSILLENKKFAYEASKCFGSQCIVASLDYGIKNSNSYVYDHNQSKLTSICLYDFTREIINSGAGEIHLCSIDKDGTSLGLDVKTAKKINDDLDIPLIISGELEQHKILLRDSILQMQALLLQEHTFALKTKILCKQDRI